MVDGVREAAELAMDRLPDKIGKLVASQILHSRSVGYASALIAEVRALPDWIRPDSDR